MQKGDAERHGWTDEEQCTDGFGVNAILQMLYLPKT